MARVEVYIMGTVAVFDVVPETFLKWFSDKFGSRAALIQGIAITWKGETLEFFK